MIQKVRICAFNRAPFGWALFPVPPNRRPHGQVKLGIRAADGWLKSGRPDLNRRPHGPEPCTLAGLSYAPNDEIIIEPYPLGKQLDLPSRLSRNLHISYMGKPQR